MEPTRSRSKQEHLTKGDIVIIPCEQVPNEDPKDRPFLIVWEAEINTYAVCPITSKSHREHKIPLECKDLASGGLTYDPSFIRPNLIQTLERDESWRKIGAVMEGKMAEVINKIKSLLDQPPTEASKAKALERPKTKQRIR